ncbi:hypothetical protein P8452_44443 [Trifolium repens]|nr:hypothetical protein P8452_44443 [Trifolium repens]
MSLGKYELIYEWFQFQITTPKPDRPGSITSCSIINNLEGANSVHCLFAVTRPIHLVFTSASHRIRNQSSSSLTGHKHLILGINNNLMPREYEIDIRPLMDDRRRQDIAAFIIQVKVAFKDNKEKYSEFEQVMKDYKDHKTGTLSVVQMGNKLFKGHTDLHLEFTNLMPDEYQIRLPLYHDHKQGHQLVIKDAFLNQVKLVFQNNMEIYFDFLQIINDHKVQGIDIRGVAAIVKELFKGHTNLILGFNAFLPKEYKITLPFQLHGHDETGKKVKDAIVIDDRGSSFPKRNIGYSSRFKQQPYAR